MTDNATDFGQEAYGQFYLPLTNKLREHDIDAISTQQRGFSGRWRMFHTGYEGSLYVLALDEDGQDSAGLSLHLNINEIPARPRAHSYGWIEVFRHEEAGESCLAKLE